MTKMASGQYENGEIERIKGRITDLISQKFASGASVYYLSQLGNDLGVDRPFIERITGRKLSQFIKDEFNYIIGVTGEHHNVLYIAQDQSVVPVPAVLPRYHRSFWAAFAIPLKEGERRFLNIRTLKFDSDENSPRLIGGEVREVAADYLAQPGSRSPEHVAQQIERWLADQQLDPTLFLAEKRGTLGHTRQSVLDVLLEALDDHQRRRVNLPLDIVHTLSICPAR